MSRRPWRAGGSVDLVVPAEPDAVYAVVSDVTRIGERSPECHTACWLPGAPAGTVRAVFRGSNRAGWAARWSRRCEVVAAERGRAFAFRTLPERLDVSRRDSTTWRYDLEPVAGGTRVKHSYEITSTPVQPIRAVYGVLMPHHRDMRPHMRANLEALADMFRTKTSDMTDAGAAGDRADGEHGPPRPLTAARVSDSPEVVRRA